MVDHNVILFKIIFPNFKYGKIEIYGKLVLFNKFMNKLRNNNKDKNP